MKHIVLIVVLSFASLSVHAAEFDGILVKLNGDTVHCQILFQDNTKYAYRGTIISTKKITTRINGEKTSFSADQIMSYSIYYMESWQTYWGMNTEKKKYLFMKKDVEGKLTMYYGIRFNSIDLKYEHYFLFDKMDGTARLFLEMNISNNRQKLTKFLSECPTVTGLIFSKEINIREAAHWSQVAEKYNVHC